MHERHFWTSSALTDSLLEAPADFFAVDPDFFATELTKTLDMKTVEADSLRAAVDELIASTSLPTLLRAVRLALTDADVAAITTAISRHCTDVPQIGDLDRLVSRFIFLLFAPLISGLGFVHSL